MRIRESQTADDDLIFAMYKVVAATPGGLARLENEITFEYVSAFLSNARSTGASLVAEMQGEIIGEIHAYSPGIFCFSHVWSDLTIAIHPHHQGSGTGRKLFESLMQIVRERKDILRVELIARESNQKAISFYKTLGFNEEGRFSGRIRNLDNSFEADIPMAWVRGHAA